MCFCKKVRKGMQSFALKSKKQKTPLLFLPSETLPAASYESENYTLSALCCDLCFSLRTEGVFFSPAATPRESVFRAKEEYHLLL